MYSAASAHIEYVTTPTSATPAANVQSDVIITEESEVFTEGATVEIVETTPLVVSQPKSPKRKGAPPYRGRLLLKYVRSVCGWLGVWVSCLCDELILAHRELSPSSSERGMERADNLGPGLTPGELRDKNTQHTITPSISPPLIHLYLFLRIIEDCPLATLRATTDGLTNPHVQNLMSSITRPLYMECTYMYTSVSTDHCRVSYSGGEVVCGILPQCHGLYKFSRGYTKFQVFQGPTLCMKPFIAMALL